MTSAFLVNSRQVHLLNVLGLEVLGESFKQPLMVLKKESDEGSMGRFSGHLTIRQRLEIKIFCVIFHTKIRFV